MTTVLNVFPQEVYTYYIVKEFTATETRNLSLVSTDGLKIVEGAAMAPHSDVTVEGEDFETNFEGNVAAFLHYKVRIAFLKNQSKIRDNLKMVAKVIRELNEKPDIEHFVQYSEQYTDLELFLSVIPFDFTTRRIKAAGERGICRALYCAVWNRCTIKRDHDAIRVVLSHPATAEIKADEKYGYIDSLEEALKKDAHFSCEVVQTILDSPYAAVKIPADDLEKLLKKAEGQQKPEVVKVLSDRLEKVRKAQPKKG
jgi:hypothetical protein